MNIQGFLKAGLSRLLQTRRMTDVEYADAIQSEGRNTIITPDAQIAIKDDQRWVRSWTRIEGEIL